MDRAIFIDSIIKDAGYDIFEKKLEEFKIYRKNLIKSDIKLDIEASKTLMDNKNLEEDILIDEQEKLEKEIKNLIKSKPELHTKKDNLLSSLDKIDDRIANLDLEDVNTKILDEKEKIETRKEQLVKIGELKTEIANYNPDNIKDKRIEYDRIKDLIKRGIITRFRLQLDTTKFGFHFYKSIIYLKNFEEKQDKLLKEYCRNLGNIFHYEKKIGPWMLELEMDCESYEKANDLMKKMKENFSDYIKSYELILITREPKGELDLTQQL
jgi:DNA-binding Lrp family transcriptional regulator